MSTILNKIVYFVQDIAIYFGTILAEKMRLLSFLNGYPFLDYFWKNLFFLLYFLITPNLFLPLTAVITRYLSGLALAIGCLHSSMSVFHVLLLKVFKWPMELFDTTPVGRIISRFAKDIDTCDTVLPLSFQSFLNTCFSVKKTKKKLKQKILNF